MHLTNRDYNNEMFSYRKDEAQGQDSFHPYEQMCLVTAHLKPVLVFIHDVESISAIGRSVSGFPYTLKKMKRFDTKNIPGFNHYIYEILFQVIFEVSPTILKTK